MGKVWGFLVIAATTVGFLDVLAQILGTLGPIWV